MMGIYFLVEYSILIWSLEDFFLYFNVNKEKGNLDSFLFKRIRRTILL
jgi:hypothetical protein